MLEQMHASEKTLDHVSVQTRHVLGAGDGLHLLEEDAIEIWSYWVGIRKIHFYSDVWGCRGGRLFFLQKRLKTLQVSPGHRAQYCYRCKSCAKSSGLHFRIISIFMSNWASKLPR